MQNHPHHFLKLLQPNEFLCFFFFYIYISCQETVDSRIRNQKSGIREPFYFIRIEEQVNKKKSFYVNPLRIPI